MRYALILVLLLLTLGCAGTGGISQFTAGSKSTGLSITGFTSTMEEIYEGGRLDLNFMFENIGAFEASDVIADLYLKDGFLAADEKTWKDTEGTCTAACKGEGDDACKKGCTETLEKKIADFWVQDRPRMRAPDIELEVPGDSYQFTWRLKAPDNIGTAIKEYPFTFKVDLGFNYTGSGWAQIPLLKYKRVQELKLSDQPMPEKESGDFPSPLSTDINFQEPVIFEKEGDTVMVKVVINHKEGGIVKAMASSDNKAEAGCSCCGETLNCIERVTLAIPSKSLSFPKSSEPISLGEMTEGGKLGFTVADYDTDPKEFRYLLRAKVCGKDGTDANARVLVNGKQAGQIKPNHLGLCPDYKEWQADITDQLTVKGDGAADIPEINVELKYDQKGEDTMKVMEASIVPDCDFTEFGKTSDMQVGTKRFLKLSDGQAILKCRLKIESDEDELYPNLKIDSDFRYHIVGEKSVKVIKGG